MTENKTTKDIPETTRKNRKASQQAQAVGQLLRCYYDAFCQDPIPEHLLELVERLEKQTDLDKTLKDLSQKMA